jgi:hypothetical protein
MAGFFLLPEDLLPFFDEGALQKTLGGWSVAVYLWGGRCVCAQEKRLLGPMPPP